jgi:hypothetical protein
MLLDLSHGSLITTVNLHYLRIGVHQPAVISWSQLSEHFIMEAWLHASHAPSQRFLKRVNLPNEYLYILKTNQQGVTVID